MYFCGMKKIILPALILLITIMACNNEDHTKTESKTSTESASGREKLLKDSISLFPDSTLLKERLIQFYRDEAEYEKAIAVTKEILLQDSLNDRFWDIQATLQFENEDTLAAIRSYETALNINPQPRYVILLGSMYAQTRNPKALEMADFLLKAQIPDTEKEAFFIKGLYYSYTGDKTKAISFFDKCLDIDYNYMIAYREKAIALYDMGKYQDAITVLDKAVTLQNNFDEGYYWTGRSLEKLNKPAEAIEEYKTALMYAPDYVEAKEALARLGGK